MNIHPVVCDGVPFLFDKELCEAMVAHNQPSYVFSELTSIARTLRGTFNGEVRVAHVAFSEEGMLNIRLLRHDGGSDSQRWALQFKHTGMHLSRIG